MEKQEFQEGVIVRLLSECALDNEAEVRGRIAYNNLLPRRLLNNIPIKYFFLPTL